MSVQYVNTFNGVDGSLPVDFVISEAGGTGATYAISNPSGIDGKWVMTSSVVGHAVRGILPAAKWNLANGELATDWITGPGMEYPQIAWRTSGDWSAEIDSPNTGYKIVGMGSSTLSLFKRLAGSTTQIATTSFPWVVNTLYRCKIRFVGNDFKVRLWIPPAAEPNTWVIDTSDPGTSGAPILAAGQIQMAYLNTVATLRSQGWDNLSLDDLISVTTGPTPRLMRV